MLYIAQGRPIKVIKVKIKKAKSNTVKNVTVPSVVFYVPKWHLLRDLQNSTEWDLWTKEKKNKGGGGGEILCEITNTV